MKLEIRHLKLGALGLALALITGCEKPTLPDGGFAAKAVLSKETIHVGDVITLTMTARHAPGSTVQFPTLGNRKEIVVRGRATETSTPAEGVLETEEIVRLTSLRTGNWLITTNVAVCTFSDGTQKLQKLPQLTLNVESTLNSENAGKLSDIKGPVKNLKMILWVILLIIAAALVAGLITLWFVKRPKALAAAAPAIPPHIVARDSLAALKNEEWVPEPFFVKLSLILRTYLEGRFDQNAPECTTEELTQKLPHEHKKFLATVFEQSDLVKFARADAQQEVMQTALGTVEQFIDQTTQEDLPQESTKNPKTGGQ
ncbi:hypothetical protein [Tichowtungia aerotolerans]|uniref:Uncharacterized protein n=1 Tax=Tichowtungia aerotolerans TaxID=2697043 RepID=A0A6P1M7T3_9BACT|nr:hypothetical protein [Tichowtungia aerotolerans]QHI70102.1 hypothetical protein GT409_11820 [Tichowtungia aerotolerans]